MNNTDNRNNENTKIFCFIGTYIRRKTQKGYYDTLTYMENYNFTYKKYKDIETEEIYDIYNDDVVEFEKNNTIVYPKVKLCNLDEYHRAFTTIKKRINSKTLTLKDN